MQIKNGRFDLRVKTVLVMNGCPRLSSVEFFDCEQTYLATTADPCFAEKCAKARLFDLPVSLEGTAVPSAFRGVSLLVDAKALELHYPDENAVESETQAEAESIGQVDEQEGAKQ